MSRIQVKKTGKREMDVFIRLPWKIYQDNEHWVPPLLSERKQFFNPDENPFFQHAEVQLFMAFQGLQPVGAIAAAANHSRTPPQGDSIGFFGFFETINDGDTAAALLDAAGAWLRERGRKVMRGPMNFSTHHQCGMLIDGFDSSPCIMLPYNPEYYPRLIEDYGFTKACDLYAYETKLNPPPEMLVRHGKMFSSISDVTVRGFRKHKIKQELQLIKQLYNDAMATNWGYTPITDEEVEFLGKSFKNILDPDFCCFAELDNHVVGFIIALPDYNVVLKKMNGRLFPSGLLKLYYHRRKIKTMRIVQVAVSFKYMTIGVGRILYWKVWEAALKKNYQRVEASWIHENNRRMIRALKKVGFKISKKYRIYDYSLDSI